MKAKLKGTRNEHRTMRLVEPSGIPATRSGGSLGVFDFVGIGGNTVVPNLNAQLHGGLVAPASAILGLTDSQSRNKTIDISLNTLKTATNTAGHVPAEQWHAVRRSAVRVR